MVARSIWSSWHGHDPEAQQQSYLLVNKGSRTLSAWASLMSSIAALFTGNAIPAPAAASTPSSTTATRPTGAAPSVLLRRPFSQDPT